MQYPRRSRRKRISLLETSTRLKIRSIRWNDSKKNHRWCHVPWSRCRQSVSNSTCRCLRCYAPNKPPTLAARTPAAIKVLIRRSLGGSNWFLSRMRKIMSAGLSPRSSTKKSDTRHWSRSKSLWRAGQRCRLRIRSTGTVLRLFLRNRHHRRWIAKSVFSLTFMKLSRSRHARHSYPRLDSQVRLNKHEQAFARVQRKKDCPTWIRMSLHQAIRRKND